MINQILKEYRKDRSFFIATALVAALVIILGVVIVVTHIPKGSPHGAVPTTTIAQVNSSGAGGSTASASNISYVARIKNLTSESLFYKNNMTLIGNVVISRIYNVSVSAAPVVVQPGSILYVNVSYYGDFGFDVYNSTPYLNATREVHYFGFYQQGTNNMLVYENRPNVSNYFELLYNRTVIGTPKGYNNTKYLSIDFQVVPTQNASGKSWEMCGGVFMSYSNNTNWGTEFNNLTFNRENSSNFTVFNMISGKCALVKVD